MVKLNKIYTKTGDDGTTGLVGGMRISKHDLRVETYGTVDEANSAIGLARLHTIGEADAMLERIQHDLFDLGADIATPPDITGKRAENPLRVIAEQVERLEREIDAMNESLTPLKSFVLPGGTQASAYLHLARTIARRAERSAAALHEKQAINKVALHYLNRLSDHLFVLARTLNNGGKADVLWKPGVNR